MEDNCTICRFIDMDKVKIKTDSSGKKSYWYWCKSKKQYIQLDLYICNSYRLNKQALESINQSNNNAISRTRKK